MYKSQFIAHLQHHKRYSQHTISAYEKDLQQFGAFLTASEIMDTSTVTYQVVRNYIADLMDHKNAESTVARKISALRSYYKFLLRNQYIKLDPMQLIKAPKQPKRLPVYVEERQMDQLLDESDLFDDSFSAQRDKLVLELLFGTGMRLAELVGLKDTDVDFYEQSVKVLGKRNKERIIPIARPLALQLKDYIALKTLQNLNNNTGRLIVNNKGMAAYPKFIYRIVNKYLSSFSTQDKNSPHILRHSYATSLLNRGADLNAIKELLGHASLAATQVYVHNSVERLKAIYNQAHPKA